MAAEVCGSAAACCSVRRARSSAAELISLEPVWVLSTLLATAPNMERISAAMAVKSSLNLLYPSARSSIETANSPASKIGSASCRERGCKYVYLTAAAEALNTTKTRRQDEKTSR